MSELYTCGYIGGNPKPSPGSVLTVTLHFSCCGDPTAGVKLIHVTKLINI